MRPVYYFKGYFSPSYTFDQKTFKHKMNIEKVVCAEIWLHFAFGTKHKRFLVVFWCVGVHTKGSAFVSLCSKLCWVSSADLFD